MKPADLEILLALAQQTLHGYGLMKAVEQQSEGRVLLELGSLYRLIARLEREGLIAQAEAETLESDRRKYYRITPLGRRALRAEERRLSRLVEMLRSRRIDEAEETG